LPTDTEFTVVVVVVVAVIVDNKINITYQEWIPVNIDHDDVWIKESNTYVIDGDDDDDWTNQSVTISVSIPISLSMTMAITMNALLLLFILSSLFSFVLCVFVCHGIVGRELGSSSSSSSSRIVIGNFGCLL